MQIANSFELLAIKKFWNSEYKDIIQAPHLQPFPRILIT